MVRQPWLTDVVRHCQVIAGVFASGDTSELRDAVAEFLNRLPAPADAAEECVLERALLEAALRGGQTLHTRYHETDPGQCAFNAAKLIERHWSIQVIDSRSTFRCWAFEYAAAFDRSHVESLAARAAALIERGASRRLRVQELSARLGCRPSVLRLVFRRHVGMSLQRYHTWSRVRDAIDLIEAQDPKLECVAEELGYRSKKDMYRAFQTCLGMTPGQFRRLPVEARKRLLEGMPRRHGGRTVGQAIPRSHGAPTDS